MYRKQVRRRRAVLVLLVVACLMLISISITEADSGPLHSVQNGVGSVLSPIQEGADRALKPARDMVNWFDETFQARGKNDDLQSEVADLRKQLVATKDAAQKAGYDDEVGKLLADDDALAGYDPVDATITGRSFSSWYGTITIGEGTSSGVHRNDAVVSEDGLLGRVSEASGGSARVILITDSNSAVAARVVEGGAQGALEPIVGSPGKLRFGLIQGGKDPEDGDTLVTAGFVDPENPDLRARLPGDIPIGKVSETVPTTQERQEVRVEPLADIQGIDSVTVLTGGPE
jgi:rod shape-determining protein MreC